LAKFLASPVTDFFLFFEPGGRPRRFAFFAMMAPPEKDNGGAVIGLFRGGLKCSLKVALCKTSATAAHAQSRAQWIWFRCVLSHA
jgi:hypothetical protein